MNNNIGQAGLIRNNNSNNNNDMRFPSNNNMNNINHVPANQNMKINSDLNINNNNNQIKQNNNLIDLSPKNNVQQYPSFNINNDNKINNNLNNQNQFPNNNNLIEIENNNNNNNRNNKDFNDLMKIRKNNSGDNINENNFSSSSFQKNQHCLMDDSEKCMTCSSIMDLFPLECFHMKCKKCLVTAAEKDLNSITCKICENPVNIQYLKMVLGDETIEKIEEFSFKGLLDDFGKQVNCPNKECNSIFFFEVGKVDYNIKDEKNKIISQQAAESYAQNRCKCPRCHNEFCISCDYTPFHLGKTCEEQKKFKAALKCKYCMIEINNKNLGPMDNICNSNDCKDNFNVACHKRLACGHDCFGTKFDKECPPCLVADCPGYHNHYGQTEDDYCNICYSEGLGAAPIVKFSCNHYVHYKCAETSIKKQWIGPKITFNHCVCPCCKKFMDCPNTDTLQSMIVENTNLYDDIVKKSLERIKFENLEKDPALIEPNSPFFGKKIDFALKKLSYYMCYECGKPYFAGLRDCRGGPDEDNNNPNKEYNKKDLICGAHVNVAGVAGKTNCPKHGKDFIEYKCKFCCQIASWFCWGTTHFCEDCHTKQCKGDYVSKYPREKLPKCPGETKCGLKVNHPANGEEYALGCSVCRNSADNIKEF